MHLIGPLFGALFLVAIGATLPTQRSIINYIGRDAPILSTPRGSGTAVTDLRSRQKYGDGVCHRISKLCRYTSRKPQVPLVEVDAQPPDNTSSQRISQSLRVRAVPELPTKADGTPFYGREYWELYWEKYPWEFPGRGSSFEECLSLLKSYVRSPCRIRLCREHHPPCDVRS